MKRMFRAKSAASTHIELYDKAADEAVMRRRELERDLMVAIDRDQLEVHYQPIVRLNDLSIRGVEALSRWRHPSRGEVPPSTFIALAESTGQIFAMDLQVIQKACRQVALWHSRRIVEADFILSVNISTGQLIQAQFATELAEILRETGMPAANLQLEITEREGLDPSADLSELKALGVKLSIDDFGAGYGCLGYLRFLPIDVIKIDGSFLRTESPQHVDIELMHSIIDLGARLGKQIVAEGVETPEQLSLLRQLGCELGQGFLLGKPMPEETITKILAPHPPAPTGSPRRHGPLFYLDQVCPPRPQPGVLA